MKKLIYLFIAVFAWSPGSRADHSAVHGMLLFGNRVTYASHLPMFHSPHDYQVLLKLSLEDQTGGKTVAAYDEAKKASAEYFTLAPELMDLTKIISGEKTTFSAAIYKGHFERGGELLGEVQVKVEKIILSTKLNGQLAPTENKYFIFGEGGEYFAAHLIQGKPNFDAVLSVNQPHKFNDLFCHTRLCPETKPVPVPDSQLPISLSPELDKKVPAVGESLGELNGVLAEALKIIYVEEGDLSH